LKYGNGLNFTIRTLSLSVWGAWIEIKNLPFEDDTFNRRSPYGERGLKLNPLLRSVFLFCRSPYGERGLKLKIKTKIKR